MCWTITYYDRFYGFPLKFTNIILLYTISTFSKALYENVFRSIPIPPVAAFTLFVHAEQVIRHQYPSERSIVSTPSWINLCSCRQIIS